MFKILYLHIVTYSKLHSKTNWELAALAMYYTKAKRIPLYEAAPNLLHVCTKGMDFLPLKISLDSSLLSSYTRVPATSLKSFNLCESGAVAIWLILPYNERDNEVKIMKNVHCILQQQLKSFLINEAWETKMAYLFDDVVRIRARETSWLQEVHDIKLRDSLPVKEVLILLCPDDTTEAYLIFVNLQWFKIKIMYKYLYNY